MDGVESGPMAAAANGSRFALAGQIPYRMDGRVMGRGRCQTPPPIAAH